jgi:hypothetical protein
MAKRRRKQFTPPVVSGIDYKKLSEVFDKSIVDAAKAVLHTVEGLTKDYLEKAGIAPEQRDDPEAVLEDIPAAHAKVAYRSAVDLIEGFGELTERESELVYGTYVMTEFFERWRHREVLNEAYLAINRDYRRHVKLLGKGNKQNALDQAKRELANPNGRKRGEILKAIDDEFGYSEGTVSRYLRETNGADSDT